MRPTRRAALALGGAALAAPWVRPSWAQGSSIAVFNWSDYIGETTVEDFTRETGIEVVYDLYASSEEMQARMLVGGTGYDAVLQAGSQMPRMVQAGVYQPLDRARLPGWGNLDPAILRVLEGFDPGNRHGMPYMWGSVGFAYNLDMVRERLPGADLADLATVFDPENAAKLADCGISILDSPDDIMFIVMSWLGLDPATAGPAEYERVAEAFRPIRPYIATFDNANYLTAIPNGELCVVNSWSGDFAVAQARAAEAGIEMRLGYEVPRTGAPAWFDLWAIPADAPNVAGAHAWLEFLLRPEVIAAATNFTGYANANLASKPFVDPAVAANPAIYPDAETLSRLYTPPIQSDEQAGALLRAWTRIKAGG